MSTYSNSLGAAAGPAYTFRVGERSYHLWHLTQARKAKLERLLRARAFASLPELRETLPPEEFESARAALFAQVAAGAYNYSSATVASLMTTNAGILTLVAALIEGEDGKAPGDEDLMQVVVSAGEPFQAAMAEVIKESLPAASPEGNGPRGVAPPGPKTKGRRG